MRFKTRDLVTAAVLVAIGIVLPLAFHLSGINGAVFLPMHIPVLISGLLLGSSLGLIVGILSPLLNHMISGMPAIPILWVMLVELAVYGIVSGLLYRRVKMTLLPSLICSMLIGRIVAALMVVILGSFFSLPFPPIGIYIRGITITALPGIIIQLILIPSIIKAYERSQ